MQPLRASSEEGQSVRRAAQRASDQRDEVAAEPIKEGRIVQPVKDGVPRRSALMPELLQNLGPLVLVLLIHVPIAATQMRTNHGRMHLEEGRRQRRE
eukprot:6170310-Prymnesium_polylepis.1